MSSEVEHRTARILVVDDVEDAADSLRLLLAAEGHDVRIALSGHDALCIAADFKPEIAVLDLGMPVMDGYQLARRLREAFPVQFLRLVALTGWDDRAHRARATEAGFDLLQVKPINPVRFIGLIGSLAA
jgi:CheY-like chemotaxis protein